VYFTSPRKTYPDTLSARSSFPIAVSLESIAVAGIPRRRACCARIVPEFLSSIIAPKDPPRARHCFASSSSRLNIYKNEPIYAGKVILDRPAARVINFICQRLNNDAGSVRAKAEWLREYWNETVAKYGIFGRVEEGVPPDDSLGGPTIAIRRIYVGDSTR
jgi:hypothetical protein